MSFQIIFNKNKLVEAAEKNDIEGVKNILSKSTDFINESYIYT